MNCKGSIQLSSAFLVKLILVVFMIIIAVSFFTGLIPIFSEMNIVRKIMLLVVIVVIYDNVVWMLIKIGMT